jgi:putative FmdB family regulatory protein
MPLYEYQCESCAERFELIQKFSDPPPETCPKCGKGPVRRLLSSPAIQFKGTGWYITDYAKKGTSAPATAKGADSKGGDSPAGESKSDAAASPSTAATPSKKD